MFIETDYLFYAHSYLSVVVLISFFLGFIASNFLFQMLSLSVDRSLFLICATSSTFLVSLTSLLWVSTEFVVRNALFDVFIFIHLAVVGFVGLLYGCFAMKRAEQAFGKALAGNLALVPIANLALIFVGGGQSPSSQRRGSGAVVIKLSIALIALLFAGAVSNYSVNLQARDVFDTTTDRGRALTREWQVERYGLHRTLTMIAERFSGPRQIDAITQLTVVTAAAGELRREFSVGRENAVVPEGFETHVRSTVCAAPEFGAILAMGGTIIDEYVDASGVILATVETSEEACVESR